MDDRGSSNLFRREGEYWTISFKGSIFRPAHSLGMHYLSRLLVNPGVDFSAHELVASAHRSRPAPANRKRIAPGGGRANGASEYHSEAARERARLLVTKRIKNVIGRIRATHPELARHFSTCVDTGYVCRYVSEDAAHPNLWITSA